MTNSMSRSRKYQMFLLDLLYPNCCPCCGKSIHWDAYLCEACETALIMPEDAFCPFCGKPPETCLCGTNLSYDRALVVTAYEGAARSGIISLKQAKSLHFARYCGEVLGMRIRQDPKLSSYDFIVPVPMFWKKKLIRCCNPAEILAREIATVTKIPLRINLLCDNGKGKSQHTLSAEARAGNVAHFSIRDEVLSGYRILLCDDVLTTGSTLNRCAALLKSCGAEDVTVVVAASTCFQKSL